MEKIAYLKGLMEGLGVHPESREGKLFYGVCEALNETAEYVKKLEARIAELEDLCDVLDEGLASVEELVDGEQIGCSACPSSDTKIKYYYTEKEEAEELEPVEEVIEEQAEEQEVLVSDLTEIFEEEEDNDFYEDVYEIDCPTCGEVITLTEQMIESGETVCPNCGEEMEIDFDEEEIENLLSSDDE